MDAALTALSSARGRKAQSFKQSGLGPFNAWALRLAVTRFFRRKAPDRAGDRRACASVGIFRRLDLRQSVGSTRRWPDHATNPAASRADARCDILSEP